MLPDRTNLTELVAAGPMKFSVDSALSRRIPQLLTVRAAEGCWQKRRTVFVLF